LKSASIAAVSAAVGQRANSSSTRESCGVTGDELTVVVAARVTGGVGVRVGVRLVGVAVDVMVAVAVGVRLVKAAVGAKACTVTVLSRSISMSAFQ